MANQPPIALIAALSKNRALGIAGELPWDLPEDLAYFKKMTLHKPIIMGRTTFESIGRPLPKRCNIVLTRNTDFSADGVVVCHSIADTIAAAKHYCLQHPDYPQEIMIIGGAKLYAQTVATADTLYLTEIEAIIEGDAFFPAVDQATWQCTQCIPAKNPTPYAFSFNTYKRKT